MDGDDRDEPSAGDDRRHDLGGETAVGREHRLEAGVVVRRPAVVLHDLSAACELLDDRLPPQVDGPLVAERADARCESLLDDRERVVAGVVAP